MMGEFNLVGDEKEALRIISLNLSGAIYNLENLNKKLVNEEEKIREIIEIINNLYGKMNIAKKKKIYSKSVKEIIDDLEIVINTILNSKDLIREKKVSINYIVSNLKGILRKVEKL